MPCSIRYLFLNSALDICSVYTMTTHFQSIDCMVAAVYELPSVWLPVVLVALTYKHSCDAGLAEVVDLWSFLR